MKPIEGSEDFKTLLASSCMYHLFKES